MPTQYSSFFYLCQLSKINLRSIKTCAIVSASVQRMTKSTRRNEMKQEKCDSCEFVGFLSSPFGDSRYGCFCSACLDGMEGDIAEREEYDSLSEEY